MDFDLSGRNAVVIGGTSGIGRMASLALAAAGANVVPTGRRLSEAEAVVEEVRRLGRKSLAFSSDVRVRRSLEELDRKIREELGQVDILVNAAGITQRIPTLGVSAEEWNNILDVNLTGTFRACQVFAPQMVERRYGRIINIASLSSFVAFQEVAAYCASKSGVAAFTRSLAVELAQQGVVVNAIAPGVFPTSLNETILQGTPRGQEIKTRTPMARFGQLQELAGAVVFLASNAVSFMTGQILAVDGGYLASGVNR